MSRILNPHFIISAPSIHEAPQANLAEVAFLGRSNVGKSSLLNALLGANLAKSSSTPGKTQLVNYFLAEIDREERPKVYFLDLPGFGYAKVSKTQHRLWQRNLTEFVQKRQAIRIFVHLIDSRHPELDSDKEMAAFIASFKKGDQLYLPVLTKTDKLGQKELFLAKKVWGSETLMTSASHKKGITKLQSIIADYLFGKCNNEAPSL